MRYTAGLLTGRLFDMGHLKLPVFMASALFVACMFLTAECTQYWQFLLCQGFGIGVSSRFLHISTFAGLMSNLAWTYPAG